MFSFLVLCFFSWQVFFQDDTVDAVAGAAIASNAALVADAVRCMPLPASRMPAHAVPMGEERFSACAEEKDGAPEEEDFTVFLTRPCLSFDQVHIFTILNPSNTSMPLLYSSFVFCCRKLSLP